MGGREGGEDEWTLWPLGAEHVPLSRAASGHGRGPMWRARRAPLGAALGVHARG